MWFCVGRGRGPTRQFSHFLDPLKLLFNASGQFKGISPVTQLPKLLELSVVVPSLLAAQEDLRLIITALELRADALICQVLSIAFLFFYINGVAEIILGGLLTRYSGIIYTARIDLRRKHFHNMEIPEYSSDELFRVLRSDKQYACLDVRERGEFALDQIPDTTPLPRGTLEYRVPKMIPNESVPVITCCDNGSRSKLSALTLSEMGFRDVKVLAGGLSSWKKSGFITRQGWGVGGKEFGEKVAVAEAVPQITAEELASLRKTGERLVLVDVRTQEEYVRGHVPGAINVPGGELFTALPESTHNDKTLIVVSCAGRTRGILGAQLLREVGLSRVCALLNGAMGWKLAGYELETGQGNNAFVDGIGKPWPGLVKATQRVAKKENVLSISLEEIHQLQTSNKTHYFIDVRLPGQFGSGHVIGSVNLPMGQIALAYENVIAVRQATLLVLADDDIRPIWAAALFRRLGFRNVFVVDGGIHAMAAHGFKIGGDELESEVEILGLSHARAMVRRLDALEVLRRAREDKSVLILDVRSSGEYASAHIPGSRWIPRGKLELEIEEKVPDKDCNIITVCDSGLRSSLAGGTLKSLGYRDVSYLDRGLRAWQTEGLTLTDGLDGADVTREEAQADFGHTLWTGALGKSRSDMERYLSWEEALAHKHKQGG